MGFGAVLLDLGQTLIAYRQQGQWPQFLRQRLAELHPLVCQALGPVALGPEELAAQAAQVIGEGQARSVEQSGHSWRFAGRLCRALAAAGLQARGEHLAGLTQAFYQPIRAGTRPYPESAAVLEALRQRGLRLAIITNSPWDTPARLLQGDLEHCGLGDGCDAFICSGEVAWRKPHPAFMLAAARALGVAPAACLVVGDSLGADIAGARAAGMRSLWVNRERAARPAGPEPDWEAGSLEGVLEVVGGAGA